MGELYGMPDGWTEYCLAYRAMIGAVDLHRYGVRQGGTGTRKDSSNAHHSKHGDEFNGRTSGQNGAGDRRT